MIDKEYIQCNYKKLIRKVKKEAKRSKSIFNYIRYLKSGAIIVTVYNKDLRQRQLGKSGLVSELVCRIQYNSLKKLNIPDLFGGTVENHGKYRIIWNSNPISIKDSF